MIGRSLRWRVAFSYIALFILAMAGLNLYLTLSSQESSRANLRAQLQGDARLIAAEASRAWPSPSREQDLNDLAERFAGHLNVRVTLMTSEGRVIGESSQPPEQLENHADRPEVIQALSGQEADQVRFSATLNQQMLYFAAPIRVDAKIVGVTRVAVSLAQVQSSVTAISSSIVVVALIITLVTILLAILITDYTTRPLRRLTQTVQSMTKPEKAGPLIPSGGDEVLQLEQAFTQLASQLQTQIKELSSERGKLEAVLAAMADGVIIADADGKVQLANEAALRIFNHAGKPPQGESLIEIVRHHQLVELWLKCQSTSEQQLVTLETSPNRLFIQSIATPLSPAMQGFTLMIFQDLTRVRRLEIVRRDFVSNVSHELRTPLASLKALTETLQEGALEDPPAARRFLLRMDHEIDNLTQLVQELLELSRIESGRVPLKTASLEPCDLVSPAVERMTLQAERAGVHLSLDCARGLPRVNADPDRIEQVLVNLIHNAIKFTPPGGEIQVSAGQAHDAIVFAVRDTGVGIEAEVLPRIFERFYKVDPSRSGKGTGLGLSIARHLVEAHGGKIWAESQPGKGSTFFFSLLPG
jgi:two-component system phosphate regulon sensor histidine kinase PhoR